MQEEVKKKKTNRREINVNDNNDWCDFCEVF